MADVEQADRLPYGRMLGQHPGARELQRHRPAAERSELGAGRPVPIVQR